MQHSINDVRQASVSNVTAATTIVAAPGADYRIVVLGYLISLDADGEYTWSSAGNALMGTQEVTADTPVGAFSTAGVLACNENELLRLTATTAANGFVRYVIVRA